MTEQPDNVSILLEQIGRASTPPVRDAPYGITLGSLIGLGLKNTEGPQTLVIGSSSFIKFAQAQGTCVVSAVPGMAPEQASDARVSALVIDVDGFHEGAWLGADDGTSKLLAEQVFETGRVLRAKGKNVYLIPSICFPRGCFYARIQSTTTADIMNIPEVDLEEHAPQSHLWNVMTDYIKKRNG